MNTTLARRVLIQRLRAASVSIFLLIAVAPAAMGAEIYVWGNNSRAAIVTLLEANGHNVDINFSVPDAALLNGKAVLINLRQSNGNTADVAAWINNGGCMITEWTGAQFATQVGLNASASITGQIGTGTPVTINAAGIAAGLADNMNNPYSNGPATEFFMNLSNLGGSAVIYGTRPGDITTIVVESVGAGTILALGYDWADQFGSSNADGEQIVLNSVANVCNGAPVVIPVEPAVPVPALNAWSRLLLVMLFGLIGLLGIRRWVSS